MSETKDRNPSGDATRFDGCLTFLSVADLEATHAFYADALGLPLVFDQGDCRIYRVSLGGYLGFCRRGVTAVGRDDDAASASGVVLTLVTEDVDGEHARLRARGVAFEKAPTSNARFAIYHAFLRDPDGYLVEIQRFDDPAWAQGSKPS
jgi:catechol 2,3-dioxygenase-like lactoylglutathione lyase family enzyme